MAEDNEERDFKSIYDRQKKNRGAQLLMLLAVLVVFVGAGLGAGGVWFGLPVALGGILALGLLFWRAVRTWEA